MISVDVRRSLVDALKLDLVGPENGSNLEAEVLTQAPSRWYLTGFLVPLEAGEDRRVDETGEDDFTLTGGEADATDDAASPEPAAARRAFFPSSIGLSLLVADATDRLQAIVDWGDYRAEARNAEEVTQEQHGTDASGRGRFFWRHTWRRVELTLQLPGETAGAVEHAVPDSDGLRVALSVRPAHALGITEGMVPRGTHSVSVFLVDHRTPTLVGENRDDRFPVRADLNRGAPNSMPGAHNKP
jgi:hypothetical protein